MFSGAASGLFTNPNPFNSAPAGSLAVADNVVFTSASVIEPRRGFAPLGASFGDADSLADAIAFYGQRILMAYDLTKVAFYAEGDGWTDFADTFEPNGTNRMRFEGAARSSFFNPVDGIRVWDGSGEPVLAGCPQGLNVTAVNVTANGWQAADSAVAYRFTVCRKDAFGRIIEGPPSGRTVLRNLISVAATYLTRISNVVTAVVTEPHGLQVGDVVALTPGEANFAAGSKTVTVVVDILTFKYAEVGANANSTLTQQFTITRSADVTCWLPVAAAGDPVTTANFLRLYRSEMSDLAADDPGDELWQCYESAYLSSADIAAGYLVVSDVAPEDVLEVPLYTNANTGDGSLAANYEPPIAEDLVYWQNRMWYANTTEKHSAQLQLIGCGSPDGLQNNDQLTFIPAGGTIFDAAVFIAKTSPNPAFHDQFQVFTDGTPGYNIQRTAQALCQSINSTSWSVPGLYAFYVSGVAGAPGKILIVAQDFEGTLGFSPGFSVYSSRGTAWTPQLPDPTTPLWPALISTNNRHAARVSYSKLGQPEAVPLLNFVEVDADNDPILRIAALHYKLLIFKSSGLHYCTNVEPFTVQKMSDHVLLAPDSVAKLGDVVYALTDQGLMAISDAGVVPVSLPIDNTLTDLSGTDSLAALKARTMGVAYRSARQYLCFLPDSAGEDNTQAYVYSTLSSGFTRYTFGARAAAVDPNTDRLVVAPTNENTLWVERKSQTKADYADAADQAIACRVVFNDLTDGEPATMKLTQQVSFLFRKNGINTVVAEFASEIHPAPISVDLVTLGWGQFPWGEVPWGGFVNTVRRVQPLPVGAANCCQLSVGFSTEQALAKFTFLGIDVVSVNDTEANRG